MREWRTSSRAAPASNRCPPTSSSRAAGIEVDGEGTAIITESCVLNDNRNPGWSKADVEAELRPLLGLDKIVWLPGIAGKDITDGHTDFYARFARPGVVVAGYDPDPESFDHDVTTRHLETLEAAMDAQGRTLEVVVLEAPGSVRPEFESDDFAAGYINFYVCNGAVIAPEFVTRPRTRPPDRNSNDSSPTVVLCRSTSTPSPPAAAESTAPPSESPRLIARCVNRGLRTGRPAAFP